jgi:hypothetical protein
VTFFATCTGVIPSYEVMTFDPSVTFTTTALCTIGLQENTEAYWLCHPQALSTEIYYTLDFGSPQSICGILHGSRNNEIIFLEFEVFISDDNLVFTSIGNFSPDKTGSTDSLVPSIFQFANSISTRYIRWALVRYAFEYAFDTDSLQFMVNCGTCAGQVGCSNTNTGTVSCIAGVNPSVSAIPAVCGIGFASNVNGVCEACSSGRYGVTISGVSFCSACPAGTYNVNTGSVGVNSCSRCPRGHYSEVTGAVSIAACQKCPLGTHHRTLGATSSESCQTCSCT